ncbi:polysaccharide deacetylase family protein [Pseudoalteromonas sp. B95]|nr:polysaccharide deacetylase family protein [Pseudoalteromonas sp. B95]
MFVSFGFDDNESPGYSQMAQGGGGMAWLLEFFKDKVNPSGTGNPMTFDGEPVRVTFFNVGAYITEEFGDNAEWIKKSWFEAFQQGHEIGNHTFNHALGGETRSEDEWLWQIEKCNDMLCRPYIESDTKTFNELTGIGLTPQDIKGFRPPCLHYNDNLFKAMSKVGILYDTGIQEGRQKDQVGGDHYWPYSLDHESPVNKVLSQWGESEPLGYYPGLWALPVYPFIVPDDNEVKKYGLDYSLRELAASRCDYFNVDNGKITGFDYNLFYILKFNKNEILATLKHTLNLRLAGNRTPMLIGMHSGIFHDNKTDLDMPASIRREILEEFVEYLQTKKEVRIVRFDQVLEWIRSPYPLSVD